MTKSEAIKDSIAHWKRMIKWVKTQNPEAFADEIEMKQYLEELWYRFDCSLCRKYSDEEYGCSKCPLAKRYKRCSEEGSYWYMIDTAHTWEEWLLNAKIMVKQLKSLL